MSQGLVTTIELGDVAELAALWQQAPELFAEEMARAATEATLLLEREVKERTPVGVGGGGGLRGSIAARPPQIRSDAVIGVVGTPLTYAQPVELGTRPHWAPIQPLIDWVRQVLDIQDTEQAEQVARRVQFKIAARGTKGQHMFRDGFAAVEPQVRAMFEAAQLRIRDRLAGAGGEG